jgi:hypothetical protein
VGEGRTDPLIDTISRSVRLLGLGHADALLNNRAQGRKGCPRNSVESLDREAHGLSLP